MKASQGLHSWLIQRSKRFAIWTVEQESKIKQKTDHRGSWKQLLPAHQKCTLYNRAIMHVSNNEKRISKQHTPHTKLNNTGRTRPPDSKQARRWCWLPMTHPRFTGHHMSPVSDVVCVERGSELWGEGISLELHSEIGLDGTLLGH